jgi:hypothetical protein
VAIKQNPVWILKKSPLFEGEKNIEVAKFRQWVQKVNVLCTWSTVNAKAKLLLC